MVLTHRAGAVDERTPAADRRFRPFKQIAGSVDIRRVSVEHDPDRAAVGRALLDGLGTRQAGAVGSDAERLLVLGGAGTGKTEVIVRRIAWDVGVRGVSREGIVALAFTQRAADALRGRVHERLAWLVGAQGGLVADRSARSHTDDSVAALHAAEPFVGTVHELCFALLRKLAPELYGDYELLDDIARNALVELYSRELMGGDEFAYDLAYAGVVSGPWHAWSEILRCYDLLNEYDQLDVRLPSQIPPREPAQQVEWCREAQLRKPTGESLADGSFSLAAARYYALLRARRALDYATVQTELLRLLERDASARTQLAESVVHIALDDAQDLNLVQRKLVAALLDAGLVGSTAGGDAVDEGDVVRQAGPSNVERPRLTAVADPCQAVFGWRGGDGPGLEGLYAALAAQGESEVVELDQNWRSTPQIVALVNRWSQTMALPGDADSRSDADDGNVGAEHAGAAGGDDAGSGTSLLRARPAPADVHPRDVVQMSLCSNLRAGEWIAQTVERLLRGEYGDAQEPNAGAGAGLRPADVAILVRTKRDVDIYGERLRWHGIPAVFRGTEDFDRSELFMQPVVPLLVAALARLVRIKRLDGRETGAIVRAAAKRLRRDLPMAAHDLEDRLLLASESPPDGLSLRTALRGLLEEAEILPLLDAREAAAERVLCNLYALEQLVEVLERPALAAPGRLREQVRTLCQWGPGCESIPAVGAPASPEAVTISTIHAAKGGEWPVVFVSDVSVQRFPNRRAQEVQWLPFEGALASTIAAEDLADDGYANERRLMYLALTRAQSCLFVTCFGSRRSRFCAQLQSLVPEVGGLSCTESDAMPPRIALHKAPREPVPLPPRPLRNAPFGASRERRSRNDGSPPPGAIGSNLPRLEDLSRKGTFSAPPMPWAVREDRRRDGS
jgi:DNA helicase-2/ATP-dependent DNA helicase PcrA